MSGPEYASVGVKARVRSAAGRSAREVGIAARVRLEAFLHPVTGGEGGLGWAPGRRPHRSDLVALLGGVEGIEHVESLGLQVDEPASGAASLALTSAGVVELVAAPADGETIE
jgi:hypothetical protein